MLLCTISPHLVPPLAHHTPIHRAAREKRAIVVIARTHMYVTDIARGGREDRANGSRRVGRDNVHDVIRQTLAIVLHLIPVHVPVPAADHRVALLIVQSEAVLRGQLVLAHDAEAAVTHLVHHLVAECPRHTPPQAPRVRVQIQAAADDVVADCPMDGQGEGEVADGAARQLHPKEGRLGGQLGADPIGCDDDGKGLSWLGG
mmetsp:Transcript_21531/g.61323  ORF Transcript_21531/g.61323 Transcript_21531/m.61323 type:complete len:202 (-) Transcript_21531:69-674(-)